MCRYQYMRHLEHSAPGCHGKSQKCSQGTDVLEQATANIARVCSYKSVPGRCARNVVRIEQLPQTETPRHLVWRNEPPVSSLGRLSRVADSQCAG